MELTWIGCGEITDVVVVLWWLVWVGTTVKPPSNGHFGTNINSSGFSPVLFKRSQSYYIDRGIKFGDLVFLSIVEMYIIFCPFIGGFCLRGSTVITQLTCVCHTHQSTTCSFYLWQLVKMSTIEWLKGFPFLYSINTRRFESLATTVLIKSRWCLLHCWSYTKHNW